MRLIIQTILMLFCAGSSFLLQAGDDKGLPIPEDLKAKIEQSIELGRELYFQDKASAISTDVLVEHMKNIENLGIGGYLTIRESTDEGKLMSSWAVIFYSTGNNPRILYKIKVSTDGQKAAFEALMPPMVFYL
jgi:hypothetical protein